MYFMNSIKIRENQIGICKKENCKFTVLQVFRLLLLFPFFSVKDAFHYSASAPLAEFSPAKKTCFIVSWRITE
jgi:hypothetical protein